VKFGNDHSEKDNGHLVCCKFAGAPGWHTRSRRVQHTLKDIINEAGHSATLEPLVGAAGGSERTDIVVHNWLVPHKNAFTTNTAVSCELHTDICITDPSSKSGIKDGSAKVRGRTALRRAQRKIAKYAPHVTSPDVFIPAAVETFGCLDKDFRKLLSQIAESHLSSSEIDSGLSNNERNILKGIFINRYYTRISVSLQIANAKCISRAASLVLACNDGRDVRRSGNNYSSARAHGDIGTTERFAGSGLSQFSLG